MREIEPVSDHGTWQNPSDLAVPFRKSIKIGEFPFYAQGPFKKGDGAGLCLRGMGNAIYRTSSEGPDRSG